MIKKALTLVAMLGALSGGCDISKTVNVDATCKMQGIDVKVVSHDYISIWQSDYRTIEFYKDDKLIGEFHHCGKDWYQCDDGRILRLEGDQVFQWNAKETKKVKK